VGSSCLYAVIKENYTIRLIQPIYLSKPFILKHTTQQIMFRENENFIVFPGNLVDCNTTFTLCLSTTIVKTVELYA